MSQDHWDAIYTQRAPGELGWHEPVPATLGLVLEHSAPDAPLIDVGGGTSRLPIELIRRGYRDLTVLDISRTALAAAREVLWQHTDVVGWIHADVRTWRPDRRRQVWHDRAVYHFLIDDHDRDAYRSVAASAVATGGSLIIAAFAPGGPERCAGLPVRRYDVGSLAAEFVPDFELVDGTALRPGSAGGDRRPYVAVVMRRLPDRA